MRLWTLQKHIELLNIHKYFTFFVRCNIWHDKASVISVCYQYSLILDYIVLTDITEAISCLMLHIIKNVEYYTAHYIIVTIQERNTRENNL